MSHSDIENEEHPAGQAGASEANTRMAELRRLILGPEQVQLENLQARLDTTGILAKDVSRTLPEAIVLSAKKDNRLSTALMPTVEEIVKASVKKDLDTFVDALFPIMGPAIRKSISEAFKQMVQSLNQALEQSFSPQGLKWRFESARTGKPFAEVVLLHSLLYRVEQVFLIHKETGILLQHVTAGDIAFQDADLVSGMLTAIQDFVRDSFSTESYQSLETIQVGEITLWIEQGPTAILAGAIRGNAPETLRIKFKGALETIHLEKHTEMDQFAGDTLEFESIRPHLEDCIETQFRQEKKKKSPLLLLVTGGLIVGLGFWSFFSYRGHRQRADYLDMLKEQKGIVVTTVEREDGRLLISGLRDPLAVHPDDLVAQSKLTPEKVVHLFKPYQALDPDFILQRAITLLHPPETVALSLEKEILIARGAAPYQWIRDADRLWPAIPGVRQMKTTDLVNADLRDLGPPDTVAFELKDGHLTARGEASGAWIAATRKRVMTLPGISRYSDADVVVQEVAELAALQAKLAEIVVPFQFNTTGHTPAQTNYLNQIQRDTKRFIKLAITVEKDPFVEIVGHTDRSGSDQRNMELSLARANLVKDLFVAAGIQPEYLGALGVGWREPVREELTEADKAMNRSITLNLYLNGPPE